MTDKYSNGIPKRILKHPSTPHNNCCCHGITIAAVQTVTEQNLSMTKLGARAEKLENHLFLTKIGWSKAAKFIKISEYIEQTSVEKFFGYQKQRAQHAAEFTGTPL